MSHKLLFLGPAAVMGAALLLLRGADTKAVDEDRLWRHRNLGKAFYEQPTGAEQAVEEFKRALDIAPDSFRERLNYGLALMKAGQPKEAIEALERAQKLNPPIPHTWFNLGILYKRDGRYPDAIRQFERMAGMVPDEPVTRYNLGLLYNLTEREPDALKQFARAAELSPRMVAPLFQLYNTHRLAGRDQEAARALAAFQAAKARQKEFDESEDMEWSFYSEIYDPIDPKLAAEDEVAPAPLTFQDRVLAAAVDPKSAGLTVFDADGDNRADLLAWSANGIVLYRNGTDPVKDAALAGVRGVVSVAAGDFDNDGAADLVVATDSGVQLFRNVAGAFQKRAAALSSDRFDKVLWLDFDHDYDVDLFLFGAKSALLRNEGKAGFAERSYLFPFQAGHAIDAVAFRVIADSKAWDLAVSYRDRAGALYRDQLRGEYKPERLAGVPAGARSLEAFDLDNDSWIDLAYAGPQAGLLLNREGKFEPKPAPRPKARTVIFADLANRAAGDLIADSAVFANQGEGRFDAANPQPRLPDAVAWAAADFDLDGRVDLAAAASDGKVHALQNQTPTQNTWLRVGLLGVKNMKLAPGTEVEIKSGARYQKKVYDGLPLLFGMRSYKQADTVRVTWPNGNIQNETKQPAGKAAMFKEAPKLSGSCPMIFTWNGREFQLLTDVLGVAPLGASAGDGRYFPVDNDEYVQIPAGMLVPAKGKYEIRITEELKEVSYLDKIQLIALDHPAGVDLFTNDKFKSPPFPEFRLFGVTRRVYPVRATDSRGNDVLSRVRRRDRSYPDGFPRGFNGVADLHHIHLDFGKAARDNRAILVMNGWVDWADGSTFLAAAQEREGGLVMPYLQVKDAAGQWKTVIEDMGIPAGKPKTIVVDLAGKFLSASREIRIVTNLCVYWDEIFLSEETAAPEVRSTPLGAEAATLRYRGFSRPVIHPERRQPESFEYASWSPASMWNATPGMYTRYGDVRTLIGGVDDRLVIMGSGDELRLLFDEASLPALPEGWKREFLLLVDGWAKDADANTAYSQTVDPLPFHGMTSYPYAPGERYPERADLEAYRREYLTRPAMRLIRPLARKR